MELVHQVYETGNRHEVGPSAGLVPSRGRTVVRNGGRAVVPNGGSHDRRDVFHVSFDPETESPYEVVTDAVQLIHDKEVDELAALTTSIDADALDDLITPSLGRDPGLVEVRFVYEGLGITITNDGNVWLRRT